MTVFQKIVLTLVLLLTGLTAGLQMLMLMGVLPGIGRMPLETYAGMWQAMDHFMAMRMPIFANATLLVYLIAFGVFFRSRWRAVLWSLVGCFALLVTDTVFTVTQQLPINRAVQALDLAKLQNSGQVQHLRDATIQHFYARGWLSISAFIWLAFAVVFFLAGQQPHLLGKALRMKKLAAAAFIVVLGSSLLHAQSSATPDDRNAALKTQLLAQVDAFMAAWKKQDEAALTALMAPEFLYASPNGVAPREGVVGALTHVCTLASYSLSDVRVLPISSDAATLVYQIHQDASCGGHADSPVVLNTDTPIHRDGKWLFLMTTSTPIR